MAAKKLPDVAFVRECVDYDPNTGVFVWRVRPRHHFVDERAQKRLNAKNAGKIAGTLSDHGYLKITLSEIKYRAHRIAWLLVYGEPVPPLLDHIDGDRLNNKIANLRAATNAENVQSQCRPTNRKGVKIRATPQGLRYDAGIDAFGKHHYIGRFRTLEEAKAARREAAEKLHGAFARHD